METRTERDSMGEVQVPAARLWGAQTQRALENFPTTGERMPREVVRALAQVKRACALVNRDLGQLDPEKADAISRAAEEVIRGDHDDEFPLPVWQTGSGTQTNMNLNEVLANRASELLGGPRGSARKVHPNDEVNRGQSTNDAFPTAIHLAAVLAMRERLLPEVAALRETLDRKAREFAGLVKIGRTHLQDATPLTLGQEISGWVAQLGHGGAHLEAALPHLLELPLGGTAVGTGLNAHPELGRRVAALLAERLGQPFVTAPNKFEALSARDGLVHAHGALRGLAASLTKIANDVRWLASGPRAGIGELLLPENEPGSSIMPGKVNPTQSEALVMACCQVMGNDVTVGLAGAQGAFQLNANMPLIAHAFLQSCRLLADGTGSFRLRCAEGIEPNRERIGENLGRSLMLVTALAPRLGYEPAARIAAHAHRHGLGLKEAALELGLVSADDYDRWVRPERMVEPG